MPVSILDTLNSEILREIKYRGMAPDIAPSRERFIKIQCRSAEEMKAADRIFLVLNQKYYPIFNQHLYNETHDEDKTMSYTADQKFRLPAIIRDIKALKNQIQETKDTPLLTRVRALNGEKKSICVPILFQNAENLARGRRIFSALATLHDASGNVEKTIIPKPDTDEDMPDYSHPKGWKHVLFVERLTFGKIAAAELGRQINRKL